MSKSSTVSINVGQLQPSNETVCLVRVYNAAFTPVAGNKLLVAHVARNKQLVARNLLPRNMLRWCKRGLK